MRANIAKQRLLAGEAAIGANASLGAVWAAEILSQAGFDFVMVDCQHGPWDDAGALEAFRAICLGPAAPMARVGSNSFAAIGRLLDRGALGIIVPLVNSAAEAEAAVHAVRYPPRGGRSWGPSLAGYLGANYGQEADHEIFLAVQIESAPAVECAEEIMAVDGIDGCWIGPMDLARSMGVDLATPAGAEAHEAAILRVLAACRKTGKAPGIDGGNEVKARYWVDRGFRFVTAGSDAGLLRSSAEAVVSRVGRVGHTA